MADNANQLLLFDSRAEFLAIGQQLLRQASQRIQFFGPNLDTVLFDNKESLALLADFARQSQRRVINILIHSSEQNVVNNHRLLALAQKMTSSIHIHTTAQQHKELKQRFLLIDEKAYLYSSNSDRYQGKANLNDPLEARQLSQQFNDLWAYSSTDTSLRRLHL